MTGESAPDPREALEAIHRYGRSMATSARARGNDEEERRWLDLLINADAALDATAAEQPTTDPADAWDPAFCRTCGWLDCECPGAARQRPTQQAATDLARLLYEANGFDRYGRHLGPWDDVEGEPRTHYENQARWLAERWTP